MSPETVELLLSERFRSGLVIGAIAAAGGGVLGVWWRIRRATPVPAAGFLITATGYLALQGLVSPGDGLWQGLLLLLFGGTLQPRDRRTLRDIAWVFTAAGGWLMLEATPVSDSHWVRWFGLLAIMVASPAVAAADRFLADAALGPLLFGASVVGVFFAVPDTEGALMLMGVSLPIALIGWPIRLASLGSPGAYGSVGVLVWVMVTGGYGRPESLVGAALCLGVLLLLPLAWLMDGREALTPRRPLGLGRVLSLVATHVVLVGSASRVVAAPRSPISVAGAALLLTLFGLGLWKWASARRWFESEATN